MTKTLPYLFLLFFSITFHAQEITLSLDYDASGNRKIHTLPETDPDTLFPEENTGVPPDELEKPEIFNPQIASVRFSPNPAPKEVEIQWSLLDDKTVTRLSLYSNSGQLLQSYTVFDSPQQKTIPVNNLTTGLYYIVLTYNDATRSSLKMYKN